MKRFYAFIFALIFIASVILIASCANNQTTNIVTDAKTEKETTQKEQVTTSQVETTVVDITTSTIPEETTAEETTTQVQTTEKVVFDDLDMDKISSHEKIPLWGEGEAPFEIKEEKVKARFAHTATIQAYIVDGSDRCVIVYPGGGYSTITASEAGDIAKEYNKMGISAFVCNYRTNLYTDEKLGYVAYHRDAFLADGQRAVQYVRYYASAFGIDPNKIAVVGFSAGGHLAMYVCEHECTENYKGDEIGKVSSKPNLCILSYAVTVLKKGISQVTTQHFFHSVQERENEELIDFYSYTYAPGNMPPTYIWYSEKDTSVDYNICSVALAKTLTELGIKNKIDGFSDGGHGIGLAKEYAEASKWFNNSIMFMNEVFGE